LIFATKPALVLPSHIEAACNEVLGRRSNKKRFGFAFAIGAVLGGVAQGLFGGIGKSIGEYLLHLLR
jgi:hypothetical protein